jgi:DNA-directed RNA polymerase specialized sigma24 family protein
MPLSPLTRVRYSAAAVERAEDAVRRARLRHVNTIIAAREAGHSLAQIGQALGVSPQRVHSLIQWGTEQRKELQ